MTVSNLASICQKTKTTRQVDLEWNDKQKLLTAVYAVSKPGSSVLTANQQAKIVRADHKQAEIHAENSEQDI